MNSDFLLTIFDILSKIKLRKYVFMLMVLMMTFSYLRIRHSRKKITREEEDAIIDATYEKDKNGQYPWEVDTNDHPDRVDKSSKPLKNDWGPKRGKW